MFYCVADIFNNPEVLYITSVGKDMKNTMGAYYKCYGKYYFAFFFCVRYVVFVPVSERN